MYGQSLGEMKTSEMWSTFLRVRICPCPYLSSFLARPETCQRRSETNQSYAFYFCVNNNWSAFVLYTTLIFYSSMDQQESFSASSSSSSSSLFSSSSSSSSNANIDLDSLQARLGVPKPRIFTTFSILRLVRLMCHLRSYHMQILKNRVCLEILTRRKIQEQVIDTLTMLLMLAKLAEMKVIEVENFIGGVFISHVTLFSKL